MPVLVVLLGTEQVHVTYDRVTQFTQSQKQGSTLIGYDLINDRSRKTFKSQFQKLVQVLGIVYSSIVHRTDCEGLARCVGSNMYSVLRTSFKVWCEAPNDMYLGPTYLHPYLYTVFSCPRGLPWGRAICLSPIHGGYRLVVSAPLFGFLAHLGSATIDALLAFPATISRLVPLGIITSRRQLPTRDLDSASGSTPSHAWLTSVYRLNLFLDPFPVEHGASCEVSKLATCTILQDDSRSIPRTLGAFYPFANRLITPLTFLDLTYHRNRDRRC